MDNIHNEPGQDQANARNLQTELETRYGGVMGQAIYDQLIRPSKSTQNVECLEVLQLSELSHRLRAHVRDVIKTYRAHETITKNWPANVVALFDGRNISKGEIFRSYRLYKKMNRDFHALYNECMVKMQTSAPECVQRWYDTGAGNDARRHVA